MGQRILSGLQLALAFAAVGLIGAVVRQQSMLIQEIRRARHEFANQRNGMPPLFDPQQHARPSESELPDRTAVPPMLPESPVTDVSDMEPARREAPVPRRQSLTVKLVQETVDGPAVVDAIISLKRTDGTTTDGYYPGFGQDIPTTAMHPDGRYALPLEHHDRYEMKIRLADNQESSQSVLIRANEHREMTVICPKPREKTMVYLTAEPLPKPLQTRNCELEVRLEDYIMTIDGVEWRSPKGRMQTVKFDPQGGPAAEIQNGDESINLRRAKPEERAVILLSGSVQYSYHISPRIYAGMTPVAVWPNTGESLTHEITPGENHWELKSPEELLTAAHQMFVKGEVSYYPQDNTPQDNTPQDAGNQSLGDKSRLVVVLTSETKNGPPPDETSLSLFDDSGSKLAVVKDGDKNEKIQHHLHSDENGRCVIGPIDPGRYFLFVESPSGRSSRKMLLLRPGQEREELVVDPAPMTKSTVLITAPLIPDDLRLLQLRLSLQLTALPVTLEGRSWTLRRNTDFLMIDLKDGLPIRINNANVHNESLEDRILFVPNSPYRMQISLYRPNTNTNQGGHIPFNENIDHEVDFDARPGENKWKIKLPDEFWDKARKELQSQTKDQ